MKPYITLDTIDGIEIQSNDTSIRILDYIFDSKDPIQDKYKFKVLIERIAKISRNKVKRDFKHLIQEEL